MEPVTLGAASDRGRYVTADKKLTDHWLEQTSWQDALGCLPHVGCRRRLRTLLAAWAVRRAAADVPAGGGSLAEQAVSIASAAATEIEELADAPTSEYGDFPNLDDLLKHRPEMRHLSAKLRAFSRRVDRRVDHAVAVAGVALTHAEDAAWRVFARDEHGQRERTGEVRRAHAAAVLAVVMPGRVWDPAWSTSHVTSLAHAMYDGRDFSAGPILADALQEAGCDDDDILGRLRRGAGLFRGCWVLDKATGRR